MAPDATEAERLREKCSDITFALGTSEPIDYSFELLRPGALAESMRGKVGKLLQHSDGENRILSACRALLKRSEHPAPPTLKVDNRIFNLKRRIDSLMVAHALRVGPDSTKTKTIEDLKADHQIEMLVKELDSQLQAIELTLAPTDNDNESDMSIDDAQDILLKDEDLQKEEVNDQEQDLFMCTQATSDMLDGGKRDEKHDGSIAPLSETGELQSLAFDAHQPDEPAEEEKASQTPANEVVNGSGDYVSKMDVQSEKDKKDEKFYDPINVETSVHLSERPAFDPHQPVELSLECEDEKIPQTEPAEPGCRVNESKPDVVDEDASLMEMELANELPKAQIKTEPEFIPVEMPPQDEVEESRIPGAVSSQKPDTPTWLKDGSIEPVPLQLGSEDVLPEPSKDDYKELKYPEANASQKKSETVRDEEVSQAARQVSKEAGKNEDGDVKPEEDIDAMAINATTASNPSISPSSEPAPAKSVKSVKSADFVKPICAVEPVDAPNAVDCSKASSQVMEVVTELQSNLQHTETELRQLKVNLESRSKVQDLVISLQNDMKTERDTRMVLSKNLQAVTDSVNAMKGPVSRISDLETLSAAVKVLEQFETSTQSTLTVVKSELHSHQGSIFGTEKLVKDVQGEIVEERSNRQVLDRKLHDLEDAISALKEKVSGVSGANLTSKKEIALLKKFKSSAERDVHRLEHKLQAQKKMSKNCTEAMTGLRSELETEMTQRTSLSTNVSSISALVDDIKSDFQRVDVEVKQLRKRARSWEEESKQAQKRIKNLEIQYSSLEEEQQKLHRKLKREQDFREVLEARIAKNEATLSSAVLEKENQLNLNPNNRKMNQNSVQTTLVSTGPRQRSSPDSSNHQSQLKRVDNSAVERVVLLTGYKAGSNELETLKLSIEKLGGQVRHGKFSNDVTHCMAKGRTAKMLKALLAGIWVMQGTWISESTTAGHFLPEIQHGTRVEGKPFLGKTFRLSRAFEQESQQRNAQLTKLCRSFVKIGGGSFVELSKDSTYVFVARNEKKSLYRGSTCVLWEGFLEMIEKLGRA